MTQSRLTMTVASKKERIAELNGKPARCWSLQLNGEVFKKSVMHPVSLSLVTFDAEEAHKYQAGEPVKVCVTLTPAVGE